MKQCQSVDREAISFVAVGDVICIRDQPESAFAKLRPILRSADIAFCNLEAPISDRGTPREDKTSRALRSPSKTVNGLTYAGFDVVSFANNHCLDYGPDAYIDTLDILKKNEIKYTGAGRNLAEARRPVFLERNIRVAFLSFASVFDPGYEAHSLKPGLVPMRVNPLYEAPHVNQEDLEAMVEDIESTKARADVLVVSHHWGVALSPTLTVSQRAIGHASIDAGADIVLGHHPHILQAIEVYKGKVICYSLANLVLDAYRPFFTEETKESIILKCLFSNNLIQRVSFFPILINNVKTLPWMKGRPEILRPESEKFQDIFRKMEKLSRVLGTTLVIEDDEVVVLNKSSI